MNRYKRFFQQLLLSIILVIAFASSASAQLYDVEVILDKILCKKAVEMWPDTQDDLFGEIRIESFVLNNASGVKKKYGPFDGTPDFYNSYTASAITGNILWSKPKENPLLLATGQSVRSGASYAFRDLTLTRALSIEFLIGGYLYDKEITTIRYQPCTTCAFNFSSTGDGFGSANNFRLMKLSSYKGQIETMATGTSKFLTIGTDQFFQLDFYETDPNSAHVQFFLKIKVTKK
jgi:hypothetical protein